LTEYTNRYLHRLSTAIDVQPTLGKQITFVNTVTALAQPEPGTPGEHWGTEQIRLLFSPIKTPNAEDAELLVTVAVPFGIDEITKL
jgi:hypothetical protein